MIKYDHFIDGRWRRPESDRYIDSVDPSSETVWARIARGSPADADAAVNAARLAFTASAWSEYSAEQRAAALNEIADLLERDWKSLVEAEVRDNGKRVSEVNAQFGGLQSWYRHFARQALEIDSFALDNAIPGIVNTAVYLPYGVVVAITPWNSPLMIAAWKVGPALAAGNTVVIKPSEAASASTLEFAALCAKSSLPPGVINVVTGYGQEVGEALVRHRHSARISFTGSETGGRKVAAAAADGVKPVTLELGGKSPQILFADADLDSAVNGVLSGIFLSNGQTCVAGSRLIVERAIHDDIVERVVARARTLRAGDPMSQKTEISPLANRAQFDKVMSMIEAAEADGAQLVFGGRRLSPAECPDGLFVEPTVFTGVTPAMRLWREEVFGPVLAVAAFDDEQQAIELANDSEYGLAAGLWTSNRQRARRVAAAVIAGTVYINHYRSVDPGSPIGGCKMSGYGRELGPDAVKDFLQVKSVWEGSLACADPFPAQSG